jgi:hypothetical protein
VLSAGTGWRGDGSPKDHPRVQVRNSRGQFVAPEIINDLKLPQHGLKDPPLPSTFTPTDNGDYATAWDDRPTRREIYRLIKMPNL